MKVSKKGLSILKKHEGLRLNAYPDAGYGWSRATIGYGHTSAAGPPKVARGMKITRKEAENILIKDLVKYENAVLKAVKVDLNQNQFDACVSLCFNIGPGAFSKSRLVKNLNKGDFIAASRSFAAWRKSNGKVMAGLVKRRADEAALFMTDYHADEAEVISDVEVDTGKPLPKSTSVWTMVLQALGTIGTAVLTLGEKQPVLVGVIVLASIAAAVYLIAERRNHGMEGLV